MTTASATAAPPNPGPNQDPPAATRSGRLLTLVRSLIDFALGLGRTLHNQTSPEAVATVTRRFGISDVKVILARLLHGLRLAAELEERIMKDAARLDRPPRVQPAARPRPDQPSDTSATQQAAAAIRTRLPTAGQIASRLRRKPIGAVIAEICHDFGIVSGDKLWLEIVQAVISHGGAAMRLLRDVRDRARRTGFFILPATPVRPLVPAAGDGPPLAIGTGPP